jgi:hypothetical protein
MKRLSARRSVFVASPRRTSAIGLRRRAARLRSLADVFVTIALQIFCGSRRHA